MRYSRIRDFATGKEAQPSNLGDEGEVRSSGGIAVRPALLDLVDLGLLDRVGNVRAAFRPRGLFKGIMVSVKRAPLIGIA